MGKISSKLFLMGCLIVIIMAFAVTYLIGTMEVRSTLTHCKYTVGTMTSDWHHRNNNGFGTDFSYEVEGIVFNRITHSDLRKGEKYLVMYDSLNPSGSLLLDKHKVPARIEAPFKGWKFSEIPIAIDSSDLSMYIIKLNLD
ncbi:hypothetical protein J8J42_10150 [Chryseobacterium sp. cx-311]|uniref:hypothetical protein n=1 Tax=Marnyiella aurantia TaxID=2758037 RepID=UPI001AE4BC0F|nr:hypothetical protein [Marnyiella aurantia]MBP0613407.1 hypothetical protein [Marnyiella aurantia]